jgi:hypothetical protein
MHLRLLFFLLCLGASSFGVARAQVAAPSHGGEVSVTHVSATTMQLEFGTTGTGQGRVVAMAATAGGMPVPLAAADGQLYTGNVAYGQGAALGTGFVVYSGTGHTATVTGLQPGTYYYITAAEYNADALNIVYNTRGTSIVTATSSAPPAPLPVELTAFTGTVDARGMSVLCWTTTTERNTNYFALERSSDGTAFTEANRVPAAGSSAQLLTYQWPDPQPLARPTHYRLRQVDRDGAAQYSSVVTLTPPPPLARQVEVYPIPSAGQPVQLLLQSYDNEKFNLNIVDITGRLVVNQSVTPTDAHYLAPLPLPAGLAPGTYVLTLAGSGRPVQKRIVVSN